MSKKYKFPGFKNCMKMMRNRDPGVMEDGFGYLESRAGEYVEELISEFEKESDRGLRCCLLELISLTKDERAFEIMCEYAKSDDESYRYWAIEGLRALNTKAARTFLYEIGAGADSNRNN